LLDVYNPTGCTHTYRPCSTCHHPPWSRLSSQNARHACCAYPCLKVNCPAMPCGLAHMQPLEAPPSSPSTALALSQHAISAAPLVPDRRARICDGRADASANIALLHVSPRNSPIRPSACGHLLSGHAPRHAATQHRDRAPALPCRSWLRRMRRTICYQLSVAVSGGQPAAACASPQLAAALATFE